ncbi:hypothetical protein FHX37_1822 [Haloactinospora alba]|uniref:Uncharacterized protein n=1 Tax=Haloactinospora alba TaxID=405555 RepID=A0A543NJF2_9ACTN|nr:hypothetical protein FHX37_1822 [Haloactinospora alba]
MACTVPSMVFALITGLGDGRCEPTPARVDPVGLAGAGRAAQHSVNSGRGLPVPRGRPRASIRESNTGESLRWPRLARTGGTPVMIGDQVDLGGRSASEASACFGPVRLVPGRAPLFHSSGTGLVGAHAARSDIRDAFFTAVGVDTQPVGGSLPSAVGAPAAVVSGGGLPGVVAFERGAPGDTGAGSEQDRVDDASVVGPPLAFGRIGGPERGEQGPLGTGGFMAARPRSPSLPGRALLHSHFQRTVPRAGSRRVRWCSSGTPCRTGPPAGCVCGPQPLGGGASGQRSGTSPGPRRRGSTRSR